MGLGKVYKIRISQFVMEIDFAAIEKKWQEKWDTGKVFEVDEKSDKEKFYVLEMFPYPSGTGLHMGHALNYTIGDILARFKIMKGFEVLHPMGYDALGLPAENAAIKAGTHPEEYTNNAIKNFIRQTKALGVSYDWSRKVNTASPDYYKWDQWIFLKMLEKGLAYQKESAVNWCPECNTVLANEQVENGKCWRHEETEVEVRKLKQWFFKTTAYADELLAGLDGRSKVEGRSSTDMTLVSPRSKGTADENGLDWPERTKKMQENWIGRSEGTEISFEISGGSGVRGFGGSDDLGNWKVFTTRPDTIFGVTFMVVAAGHDRLDELVTEEQRGAVDEFLGKIKSVSEKDSAKLDKEGVFTGSYMINPANGERIPIWAGNFVLADYGSGMVMAVPAHDARDFEFAKKYGIEIRQVVAPIHGDPHEKDVHRETITAIVHRESDDKYLMIKWKKFDWISPVIGGIDKEESIEEAAKREVLEETGYNVSFVRNLEAKTQQHFYAKNKEVWRSRMDHPVLLELIDEEQIEISCEEKDKHDVVWLSKGEVLEKMTHEENLAGFLDYFGKSEAYTGNGKLCNSKQFDGMDNVEAKSKVTDWLIEKGIGKRVVNFKLRDWGVSRQRYWGTPIPIIYCEDCGTVAIPESELPVVLPRSVKFGEGNPLESNEEWLNAKCPKCGKMGRRECDTMDTFVNSSWYFLRYTDPNNSEKIFDSDKVNAWNPVDAYIGGAEHACMHLLYARFYTKVLRDIGVLNFDEPFTKLFHQGMLHAEDGRKMSKSLGNVIDPLDTVAKYGVDATRWFLISVASPDKDFDWNDKGISGATRFIKRVYEFYQKSMVDGEGNAKDSVELISKLNLTIKNVGEYYGNFNYRKATIELRELFSLIEGGCSRDVAGKFLKLISPICPHVAEELWEKLFESRIESSESKVEKQKAGGRGQRVDEGSVNFISTSEWPEADEGKISKNGVAGDLNGKIVERIKGIIKEDTKKVYVYVMPFEMDKVDAGILGEGIGKRVEVFAVNDSEKVDPKGMAKRAKPGLAAIYLE